MTMLSHLYILFITFGITDAIDIFLVAIMLYQLYKMVKGTAAVNVFIGLALIYIIWIIVIWVLLPEQRSPITRRCKSYIIPDKQNFLLGQAIIG